MKKLLTILTLALIPFLSPAQEKYNFGLGLGLDFSKDAYEGDINFTYYPVPTFGIRASLGMAGEYRDLYDRWFDDWGCEHYSYADDYTWRFKFSPSIELRSPALVKFSDTSSLRLFANPGVTLSPGAEGSRGAKWFTWQIRGGLEFDFGSIALQMGYRCTNFYLYSGNPFSRTEYEFDRDLIPDRYTHSGFIAFLIRF
ncbi:MAG: hypothetical protein NC102_01685 [Clostridium sp.]|nr:hypothetical protein [Clostridium sp.]